MKFLIDIIAFVASGLCFALIVFYHVAYGAVGGGSEVKNPFVAVLTMFAVAGAFAALAGLCGGAGACYSSIVGSLCVAVWLLTMVPQRHGR